MSKRVFALVLAAMLLLALVPASVGAEGKGVPKLRVFVHNPNPGKPKPVTCDPTTNDQVTTYGLTGWTQSGVVIYHVNYGSAPKGVSNVQKAIANAYGTWEGRTAGKVDFQEGSTTALNRAKADGVDIVAWGSVSGSAIAVTYTWYWPDTGEVVDQDVILNSRLAWAFKDPAGINPDQTCGNLNAYDLQDILTHELGHVVGLDDLYSSADHDLTMYGYGSTGELKKDTLGNGDLLGMADLY